VKLNTLDIDAVIFDLDNTLLDRDRTFLAFVGRLTNTYFPGIAAEEQERIVRQILEVDQDGYNPKPRMFKELLGLLPWTIKPDVAELLEYYRQHYTLCAALMDSALELLEQCRERGWKIGLITNGRNDIQYGKIDALRIRDAFDTVVVSEGAGVKKPDARIFRMALDTLDVVANRTLFIGDHPVNDIRGAADVGMHTVWVQRNQAWDDTIAAKPLLTIKSLNELIQAIR